MSKYTVTIWESDFHNGAFVSGVEKFDCIVEARQYFETYEGDQNLHVVLEQCVGERNKTLAEINHDGTLYALDSEGKWQVVSGLDFRMKTKHMGDLLESGTSIASNGVDTIF